MQQPVLDAGWFQPPGLIIQLLWSSASLVLCSCSGMQFLSFCASLFRWLSLLLCLSLHVLAFIIKGQLVSIVCFHCSGFGILASSSLREFSVLPISQRCSASLVVARPCGVAQSVAFWKGVLQKGPTSYTPQSSEQHKFERIPQTSQQA